MSSWQSGWRRSCPRAKFSGPGRLSAEELQTPQELCLSWSSRKQQCPPGRRKVSLRGPGSHQDSTLSVSATQKPPQANPERGLAPHPAATVRVP